MVTETLRHGIYTSIIGRRLLYFSRLASIMETAKEISQCEEEDGIVLVTCEQTGMVEEHEHLRRMSSTGLFVAISLRPPLHMVPFLSMTMILALIEAIRNIKTQEPEFQWPNSISLDGKRVAETMLSHPDENKSESHTIVGVAFTWGRHSNNCVADLLPGDELLKQTSASPLSTLLKMLLEGFDVLYRELRNGQPHIEDCRNLIRTVAGQSVDIRKGDTIVRGNVRTMDQSGNIIVERFDGTSLSVPFRCFAPPL